MADPDYGYGDAAPEAMDYGYGDAAPSDPVDYGYGDDPAPAADYGYGDATPDYGYGDDAPAAAPAEDDPYGYGDQPTPQPADPSAESRRPKRRCSVTRYTIESEDKESALTAHARITDFRNGVDPAAPPAMDDGPPSESARSNTPDPNNKLPATGGIKKKGMMHKLRKRLSIVT